MKLSGLCYSTKSSLALIAPFLLPPLVLLLVPTSLALTLPHNVAPLPPPPPPLLQQQSTLALDRRAIEEGPGLLYDLELPLPVSLGCVFGAYGGSVVLVVGFLFILSGSRRRALKFDDSKPGLRDLPLRPPFPESTDPTPISPGATGPGISGHDRLPQKFPFPPPPSEIELPPGYPSSYYENLSQWAVSSNSTVYLSTKIPDPFARNTEDAVTMALRRQASDELASLWDRVLEHDEQRKQSSLSSSPSSPSQGSSPVEPAPEHINELPVPPPQVPQALPQALPQPSNMSSKKKTRPTTLKLDQKAAAVDGEKRKSRGSALLSAILSPRRKMGKGGLTISSPILTPSTAAFPVNEGQGQEMSPLSPRHYKPMPPPPPVPSHVLAPDQSSSALSSNDNGSVELAGTQQQQRHHVSSRPSIASLNRPSDVEGTRPDEPQSIDEMLMHRARARSTRSIHSSSGPQHEREDLDAVSPVSAVSANSQAPLMGLPTSPKPDATRFSGLPLSPKPGATFQTSPSSPSSPSSPRTTASAVRPDGALALRAYQSDSPISNSQIKHTVFAHKDLLSPMSPNTVPYSPYQPQTPCIPMSPTLVTKKDRIRMKQMQPKTPTVEMVKSSTEMW